MIHLKDHLVKDTWSYYTGAILLAIINTLLFIIAGKPWQITTGFTYWGAWIWRYLGGSPEKWSYFANNPDRLEALSESFLTNSLSLMDTGLIIGSLLSVLLVSQFKFKKLKSFKQVMFALLGGIIMGYGTRISFGCNIGAFFSSIPSLSLSGWLYAIFAFLGAWIGSKILMRFLL